MAQPLLAEYEGELLAAVIVVRQGERAIYMYGASSTNRTPPNAQLFAAMGSHSLGEGTGLQQI